MRRRRRRLDAHDGVAVGTERTVWGHGEAVSLVLSHATGFCKEVWRPLTAELRSVGGAGDVLAVDHRGHGDSDAPPSRYDWWDLARDLAAVGPDGARPVGVGHSGGAAALAMAEISAPGSFRSLVLIEPIIFPGPQDEKVEAISGAALRRKRWFASAAEAHANFAGKRPFRDWDARALEAYVRHGLTPSGGGWTLKCTPEAEAEAYRAAPLAGAWERLAEIHVPVTIVVGEGSDTHPRQVVEEQAAQFGSAEIVIVPGTSHMVPMERPDLIAAVVLGMVRRSGSGTGNGRR